MTRSVESRFIAIVSGALLVVVAPLFTLFLALSSQQAANILREQVRLVLTTHAQALGKPVWELDAESVRHSSLTLLADPVIHSVQVSDNLGKLNIVEMDINPADFRGLESITRPIIHKSREGDEEIGSITVYVSRIGWFSTLNQVELAFIAIFVVAILTVFAAAILGNRMMVIRPLIRLTAAIEATRRLGSRHHVDWRSNDEMGRLARSFNEMQELLEREERELKRTHRKTTEIYNRTPAMLFSLDNSDLISAVSDYWLLATGYERQDIISKPFADLVAEADRALYAARKANDRQGVQAPEITVRFIRRDGDLLDVLIAERELSDGGGAVGSLNVMTDITNLKQSEHRNRQQAITDHLTGLLNRQGFEAALDAGFQHAVSTGDPLACLFVDLDRFKTVNDNLGHAAGDDVLCQVVARMEPLLRKTDTVSRLGGDEFAILVGGADARQWAHELCARIIAMFDLPFSAGNTGVRLSASVGLAFYPDHAASSGELLQKSDLAMYARKRDGKNGALVYDPVILDRARERAEIESDIEAAIAGRWFEAYFQPIVDIHSASLVGFEALMRLRHPEKGLMSPAGIICVAEENGQIGRIGNLILEEAVANLARLSSLPGMHGVYVAVNFSPLQFEPSLPVRLAGLLGRHGIRPNRLVVEITEAVLMHDNPEIRVILDELHRFGCRIALDDFGTGYSSLSYMSRFPVDIVKIDQSFVRSIDDESDVGLKNRMLVEGIATISHKMNCKVIAEGVETAEQRAILQDIGSDCAQGYYFSRPQSVDQLMEDLADGPVVNTAQAG